MQLVGFSLFFWERGMFPAELQLDLGERKKVRACSSFWKKCPFLSLCCIYTPFKWKGVFRGLDKVVPTPLLGYLGLVSILILS
jgi:hypothetical protein